MANSIQLPPPTTVNASEPTPAERLEDVGPDEMTTKTCSICQAKYEGWGNNAWPVNDGECCDDCNSMAVIPARVAKLIKGGKD
jgi:hypothetical protein